MKHLIKTGNTLHGVIGFRHEGNDQQYCEAGSVVQLEWQPEAGWGLEEAHYTDGSGNVVEIDIKTREFEMPDSEIVIEGTFKRFVVEDWKNYKPGGGGGTSDYNDLENKPKINDVTLQGNKTSEQLGIVVPKRIKDDPTGLGVIEGNLQRNKASGEYSHAEGRATTASGFGSHAEGIGTEASGEYSHAEGNGTVANRAYQRVFGKYNTVEEGDSLTEGIYAEIIGNGTRNNKRSNARTLSWDGKEWLADTLEVSREPETENEVATRGYVDGKTMKRVVVDEEKLIGEWVEGGVTYDLYEKVVAFGELPNSGQKQVEHGITNKVRFVDVKGFAYGDNSLSIPFANADGTLFIYLGVGNTKITIESNRDRINLTGYVYLTFIRSKP